MKKLNIFILLLSGSLLWAGCGDGRDDNPVFQEPTEFNLNTPAQASDVYDLKNLSTIELTCSQPNYGYVASTAYKVQLSLENAFKDADETAGTKANYVTLSATYILPDLKVDAMEFAMALLDLWKVSNGSTELPETPMPVYIRLNAALSNNGMGQIVSNVIELPKVLGYNVEPPVSLPAQIFLVGDFASGSSWGKWVEMIPVTDTPGKFWSVQYFGGNNVMKFNAQPTWDGNQVAYAEGLVPDASASYAGVSGVDDGSGGQNIGVKNAGWYIMVVTSALDGKALSYTLEFLSPDIYLTGDPSGGWDIFDEARKFTVPNGEGEFISPAFVASGALRMCIKLPSTDWWRSEFTILNNKIEYRKNGGDQEAVNVSAGQKAYLNFLDGTGRIK
ncbi:SusF/SusE family outer membrane protein [uncultured Parabacteroides sp.]|uniref:SusF/SusE family outer membrane protein n=1 Tax=uncultured Parabacteroides sp. TaxID=512312 RepID=UPI002582F8AB|nr:SusF/SusE family outer membrane protein [uncultured Parabacteroides sp.]